MPSETRYLSCAETAKLVREALKERFPRCSFSVRSSTYSMGASISVRWTDGPTEKYVDAVLAHLVGSDFDSQTDSRTFRGAFLLNGEKVKSGADHISTTRTLSDRAWQRCAEQVAAFWDTTIPPRERAHAESMARLTQNRFYGHEDFGNMVWRASTDRTRFAADGVGR